MGEQVMLRRHGGPDVLKTESFEAAAPGERQVVVRVAFAGVNFAELMQRVGLYQAAPKLPFVPGFELSGIVEAAGPGSAYKPGDRVAAVTRFGGYTTHATLDDDQILPVPDDLSLQLAAALPVTYLTAWVALHDMARVRRGETVLVHGGAGGVGLAAIALGQHAGCNMVATAGGPQKKAFLADLGVAAIDYKAAPWQEQARSHGSIDCVLDGVGGRNMQQSLDILGPLGRVVVYGGSDMIRRGRSSYLHAPAMWWRMHVAVPRLVRRSNAIMGLHALHLWDQGVDLRSRMTHLLDLVASGQVREPTIAATFPLADAAQAHAYIHARQNIGKVLLAA